MGRPWSITRPKQVRLRTQDHVRIRPAAVEAEQIHHPQRVPVVLLTEHIAVHAEDAYVSRPQGIVVHVHHRAVVDIGLHGVALDPHRQLRPCGDLTGDGQGLIILPEYRGGIARCSRGAIQRDDTGRRLRGGGLQLLLHGPQRIRHGVEGLAPGEAQPPVLLQQAPLLVADPLSPAPVGIPIQIVGLHMKGIEQPQQHLLLGSADAGLIIAHRRPGYPQPVRQLRAGQAQLFPALLQLIAKAHGHALLRLLSTVSL